MNERHLFKLATCVMMILFTTVFQTGCNRSGGGGGGGGFRGGSSGGGLLGSGGLRPGGGLTGPWAPGSSTLPTTSTSSTASLTGTPSTTPTSGATGTIENAGVNLSTGDGSSATGSPAAAKDNLAVYFFSGTTCGPCNQMKNGPWPAAQAKYSNRVNFIMIDAWANPDQARAAGWDGGGVPSFRFVRNGQAVDGLGFTGFSDTELDYSLERLVAMSSTASAGAAASGQSG